MSALISAHWGELVKAGGFFFHKVFILITWRDSLFLPGEYYMSCESVQVSLTRSTFILAHNGIKYLRLGGI